MTVRELINKLLDMPSDMEVTHSGGNDPYANLLVDEVYVGETYNHPEAPGRKRTRKVVVLR